ncbi:MAG: hypothetical protein LBB43_04390 [Spirochaetaceae bacterium]|jgi:hypothetical protein|nr:hypothetical protein [Spirochaetaceae bacterium]
MASFISENLSTIIIGGLVFALLACAFVKTILNIRKGKSSCGCEHCNCGLSKAAACDSSSDKSGTGDSPCP